MGLKLRDLALYTVRQGATFIPIFATAISKVTEIDLGGNLCAQYWKGLEGGQNQSE